MRATLLVTALVVLLMVIPAQLASASPAAPTVAPRHLIPNNSPGWATICNGCTDGNSPTGTSLMGRQYGAMAYDSSDRYAVLFGGEVWADSDLDGTTWAYSGGVWHVLATQSGGGKCSYFPPSPAAGQTLPCPSPREGDAMAYDPAMGGIVLYGGTSDLGYPYQLASNAESGGYTDIPMDTTTWEFSNGQWVALTASAPNNGVAFDSLVYDPSLGGVVMGGGIYNWPDSNCGGGDDRIAQYGFSSLPVLNSTSKQWTTVSSTTGNAPRPLYGVSMAFDPTTDTLMMEGGGHINSALGFDDTCTYSIAPTDYYGDTWSWKGGTSGGWTDQGTSPQSNNVLGTMVYDKSSGQVLLIGGSSPGSVNWVDEWTGSSWSDTSSDGPGGAGIQEGGSAAYDSPDGYVVFLVGTDGASSETLAWPPPFSAAVTSYPTNLDAGQHFSATVSISSPLATAQGWAYQLNWTQNGASVGSCAWGWTNPGGSGQTTASCSAPSASGSYGLLLTASIGNSDPARASQTTQVQGANSVVVYPDMVASINAYPSPAWVETGRTLYLNGSVGSPGSSTPGGESPYTYAWANLSCSNINGNPGTTDVQCIGGAPGKYNATFSVTDAAAATASTQTKMIVYSPIAISNPNWVNQDIDSGSLVSISATISGGYPDTSARVFNWSGLPSGCSNTDAAQVTCQPTVVTSPVHPNICLNASDPSGTATLCGYATIEPPLKLLSYVSNRTSVDGNQWVGFTATVSGGTGSYSGTSWSVTDISTGTTLPCLANSYVNSSLQSAISTGCEAPNALSNQTLRADVTVADGSINGQKTGSLTMPIYPDPYVTQSNASVLSIYSNKTVDLFGAAAMGTGIYSYAWTGLPPGCTSQNVSVLACTPNVTKWQHGYWSLYDIYLWINDSNGFPASWAAAPDSKSILHPIDLTVYKDPFLFVKNQPGVDVGQAVSFQLVYNGAYGTLTAVNWLGLPASSPACTQVFNQYSAWANCTANTAGPYQVTVQVTEKTGSNTTYGWLNVTSDPVIGTLAVPSGQTVGQKATFTLSGVSGGLYPYTFNWTLSAIGCTDQVTGNRTLVVSCIPTVSGTQAVSVFAMDGNGWHSNIASAFVTFGNTPAVSIAPAPAITDSGLYTVFTSSVSGGSYNYLWSVTPTASCIPAGSVTYQNCTWSASGTYIVNLTLTNSAGYVTSTQVSYAVNADPSALLKESRSYIDLGQQVKFSMVAAGGLSPYTYSWFNLPLGCTSVNQSSLACTPSASGNFSVTARVNDTLGLNATTNYVNLTVVGGPALSKPIASRSSIDNGQGVNFTVFVTNSSGNDIYSWNGLPATCPASTTSTIVCSYLVAGTYHITATVTDSNGQSALSPALQYTVLADPSVKLTGPTGAVDASEQVLFTALATNGSGIYHYMWGSTPPFSCSPARSPTDVCAASSSGTGAVTVNVTDSNGEVATAALTVTANPMLLVNATITAGSTTIPLNQTSYQSGYLLVIQAGTTFSVSGTASGGAPPYKLNVSVNGTVIGRGSNQSSLTATSSMPDVGVFPVEFSVADRVNSEDIQGAIEVSGVPMNVSLQAPLVANASIPVNLTAHVTGGVGPFTFIWTAQNGFFGTAQNTTTTTSSAVAVHWLSPGQYNVSVTVVDGQRVRALAQTTIAVGYTPLTVTWTAHSPIDQNASENVSVTVTGGTNPYAYRWYEQGAPGGGRWTTTVPYSHLDWPATGTFNASVTVTDADGATGTASGVFVVGSGISVACSPTESGSLTVGGAVTFSLPCSPHGGIPPYTYDWELVSGSNPDAAPFANGTGTTYTHTFQSTGNYLVIVWVQDSTQVGGVQAPPGSFHVSASQQGGGLSSLTSSTLFWAILIPLVALAAFLLVVFMVMNRRKKSAASRQQTLPPETTGASLSPLQWAILEHLEAHPLEEQGRLAMAVGDAQTVAPGEVRSAIGLLGPMGLLDSRQNVEDKETRYELTDPGKKLLAKHRATSTTPASEVKVDETAISGTDGTSAKPETSTPDTGASAPWLEGEKDETVSPPKTDTSSPNGHKILGEERKATDEANPYKGRVKPEDVNPQLAGKKTIPAELLQPMELQQVKDRGTVERIQPGGSGVDYDAKARELEAKTKGVTTPQEAKPKRGRLRDHLHRQNKGSEDGKS